MRRKRKKRKPPRGDTILEIFCQELSTPPAWAASSNVMACDGWVEVEQTPHPVRLWFHTDYNLVSELENMAVV